MFPCFCSTRKCKKIHRIDTESMLLLFDPSLCCKVGCDGTECLKFIWLSKMSKQSQHSEVAHWVGNRELIFPLGLCFFFFWLNGSICSTLRCKNILPTHLQVSMCGIYRDVTTHLTTICFISWVMDDDTINSSYRFILSDLIHWLKIDPGHL